MKDFFRIIFFVFLISGLRFCVSAQNSTVFFPTTYTISAFEPNFIVAADINGDEKKDLICANLGADSLSIFTNNGLGSFGSNATIHVPQIQLPTCVAAGDVNGDGKIDLINANYAGSGTVTVFTNNANGVFNLSGTYNAGNDPQSVAVADVNGDGKLDLCIANATGKVTILTNNGNGAFIFSSTVIVKDSNSAGFFPYVIAIDINGDGKPDLITADDTTPGTLSILTNNGNGTFKLSASPIVGNNPTCVVAADINGDGKIDLISADSGTNTFTVLTNNGSGVFVYNATYSVGNGPNCVVATDINGDGKPDLISANFGGIYHRPFENTLTILTNNGFGSFGSNTVLTVGQGPAWAVAADFDNDGKTDLACVNYFDVTFTTLIQTIVEPPNLQIQQQNFNGTNFIIVSWSSFSTNFILQTNTDLRTSNWGNLNYPISITNNTNSSFTTTSSPIGNLFLRLKQ